jgi:hypothetical protein
MSHYLGIGCAGEDEPGANYTPPTLGDFMKKQKTEIKRLREDRAGAQVIKEAKEFHLRQSAKHGINTNRGLAHFRASKMYTREGNRLQEMFENGGDQMGELPPKAIMKANKAAMMFHKKQADKAGLDSDLGHAHVAAMEHHQDIFTKAKQQAKQGKQQPEQGQSMQQSEAGEGGPGSGPQGGKHPKEKSSGSKIPKWNRLKAKVLQKHGFKQVKTTSFKDDDGKTQPYHQFQKGKDIIAMNGSQNTLHKGVWDHFKVGQSGGQRLIGQGSQAGELHQYLNSRGLKASAEATPGISGKQSPVPVPKKSEQPSQDIQDPNAPPVKLNPQDANKPMMASAKRRKRIANFGRESNTRSRIDDGLGHEFPRGAGRQVEPDLVTRQPRTKESSMRRSLRRPVWETDDSERDRSASGLTA